MYKSKKIFLLSVVQILILAFFISAPVKADTIVFVQGYLGASSNWKDAGIERKLSSLGWRKGGTYYFGSQGAELKKQDDHQAKNQYITIDLPTTSSLSIQSHVLATYLKHFRKSLPNERLILVAHSAGGVLSRLVMVLNPNLKVSMLITIASPHLGSDLAELANLVGNTPLALFAPLMGAELFNQSQALYEDLLPEQPGRLLYWLNRQPHPSAQYISIVRNPESKQGGDFIVPAYSHDLRNVESLKNIARSYIVEGSHSLNPSDGVLIFDILTQKKVPPLTNL